MRYSETLKYDAAFTIDQDSVVQDSKGFYRFFKCSTSQCLFSYLLRQPVQVTGFCLHFFRYMYHSFSFTQDTLQCFSMLYVLMGVSPID